LRAGVPKMGEHTREILVELGFDDAEVADFFKSKTVYA
jgi:crotonobetainyl-CoA:carnitine CoA-transferase CaiB-like acyl-CoA transferase